MGARHAHFAHPLRRDEFNASTFTCRVIAGTGSDIHSGHLRRNRRPARPSTAAQRVRFEVQSRYGSADEAEATSCEDSRPRRCHRLRPPVYTTGDPRTA